MDFTAELGDLELGIIEAIKDCKGQVKGCAESAVFHLERAYRLIGVDDEMALFRAITAEEEATNSLFFCLKNNNYKNANKIELKNHLHKLGLNPCLDAVIRKLSGITENDSFWFDKIKLRHSHVNGRKCIMLGLRIRGTDEYLSPIPPLNFSIDSLKPDLDGKLSKASFSTNIVDEFQAIARENQAKDIMAGLKQIAQQRNILLYSALHNFRNPVLPEELNVQDIFNRQKRKTFRLLGLVLMIDPWEKSEGNSLFVQTVIDSYLLALGKIQSGLHPETEQQK